MRKSLLVNVLLAFLCLNFTLLRVAFGQDNGGLTLTVVIGSADTDQVNEKFSENFGQRLSKTAPPATITVAEKKKSRRAKKQPRYLHISEEQIIVSLIDANGVEIYRAAEHDPRLIRMEAVDDHGGLGDGKYYESTAVGFSFTIPQVSSAELLILYKPVWNGQEFTFDKLAEINVASD